MALIDIPLYILTLFEFIMFILGMGECVISNTKENHGIFFGVIATPSSPHQQFMYDTWIKNVINYSPESKVAFITNKGKEIPGVLYVHPGQKYEHLKRLPGSRPIDRDIVIKRLVGAKYFLENTNLDWFWSVSDDCLIYPNNIPDIIDDLNSRYNTYTDSHIEGHCIEAWGHIYMQGGSGDIFSRKAAEKFVKIGMSFIRNMTNLDDIEFEKMRKILGVSVTQSASKFMYGHKFVNNVNEKFYENLDYCPSSIPPTKCYGDKLISGRHLTGYHTLSSGGVHFLPSMLEQFKIVQEQILLHPDISYYHDALYLHFCKKNLKD